MRFPRKNKKLLTDERFYKSVHHRNRETSNTTLLLTGIVLVLFCFSGPAAAASSLEESVIPPCAADVRHFDPATNVKALTDYNNAIAQLLKDEKFKDLDCIADWARSSKARFPGGAWILHNVYVGLERPRPGHATEEDWQAHLTLLEHWKKKKRNSHSITARIALAESYVNYGWNARGSGYSDTVSESGWKLLGERMARAKSILDNTPNQCPEWYVAMQLVATGQNWDLDRFQALLEKAIVLEPQYQYFYREQANILLPKWQGNEGDAARFTEQAANRLGGDAGDVLYFGVASFIACGCEETESTKYSWPRIQRGFAATERQYGPSLNNLNAFALLAVKFKDHITADAAFQRIGDNWDEIVWRTEKWFNSNKSISAAIAPLELERRAERDEATNNVQTPEGEAYKKVVLTKIEATQTACLAKPNMEQAKFELWMLVAESGDILSVVPRPRSPLGDCVMWSLLSPHKTGSGPLPPPPHAKFWMILDVDTARTDAASR